MNKQFRTGITYFLQEGRENLTECLEVAFKAAVNHKIKKIIIFTAEGLGVQVALDEFCSKSEFSHIKLVAVTFPVGQPFTDVDGNPLTVEIGQESKTRFRNAGVPIVRAHMPFDPISPPHLHRGVLGQDLSLVASALNVFGGSMSLCVQAVVIACDAGAVARAEHVIALTSDTAILAQATPTTHILTELAIREVLCKPVIYSIGRGEKADQMMSEVKAPELKPPEQEKMLKGQVLPPEGESS
jgi:hypothetical protein